LFNGGIAPAWRHISSLYPTPFADSNPFKGLTIRQQIARKVGSFLHAADLSEYIDPYGGLAL